MRPRIYDLLSEDVIRYLEGETDSKFKKRSEAYKWSVIDEIVEIIGECSSLTSINRSVPYGECEEELKNYSNIGNRIIQKVIKKLEEKEEDFLNLLCENYGKAISALINLSPEKEFYLSIGKPWSYFGMYNKNKKIVIEGDVGDWIGYRMKGGEIIVKGNVRSYVGPGMRGGKIIIEGNGKKCIGGWMKGGKIYIGKLEDPEKQISAMAEKGEIYRGIPPNVELVWKDGKFV